MSSNEYQFVRRLKALANRRRLSILKYLKRGKEASVGDIADAIHLSLKATSKHLGILAAADAVSRDQRSLNMFYRLHRDSDIVIQRIVSLL